MKRNKLSIALLFALALLSNAAMADEACGSLCEKGFTLGATHKSDFFANRAGGIARGSAWLRNSEVTLDVDLGKLAGMNGASVFIQYHAQHGDLSINDYAGSFAGVSNIETGQDKSQFYQAWLQQTFADDQFSLLAGLYAVDSEFYVTETSGLFLQPPYGMSAEMAQGGRGGPPVFPLGALGARMKYSADNSYMQIAVTDGVPGYRGNLPSAEVEANDGVFAVAEFAYQPPAGKGLFHKTALGLWHYSSVAADRGFYLLAERTLLTEPGNPGQGLAGFVRFGTVNPDLHQADWSASLGVNYQGLFDGRDNDAAGFAVTVSHTSQPYRQSYNADSAETTFELTYRAELTQWLALQPSLQYINNPNMDRNLKDVRLIGLRLEAGF